MDTLLPLIKSHSFFQGLKDEYLELLLSCATNVRFREGDFLFQEGEESRQFYIIRQGLVAVQIPLQAGHSLTIQNVGENDILGWSWLFPPHYWRFNAVAKKDTRAVALDGECLRNKCNQNHELGYELTKRFARVIESRLDATRMQLLDVIINSYNVEERDNALVA